VPLCGEILIPGTVVFGISPKRGGWITLTPLAAQPEPPQLKAFKAELNATWPMTGLLDMIKETDLRLGFTNVLQSPTAYETLERSVLHLGCYCVCTGSEPMRGCNVWRV
jgi:hypothetical protein